MAALLLPLAGVAALAPLAGIASWDTGRFAATFALFLLPGWVAGARLVQPDERDDPILRPCLALLLSYLAYGSIALGCRALGLGFAAFYTAFASLGAVAIAWGWRAAAARPTGTLIAHWREHTCVALAVALSVALFVHPFSNDVSLFELNLLESLELRSFAPSALDVRILGVDTPQPRMQANLMHSFFAVLGVAADVSPRVLIYYVAPPFLGLFALLALTCFVRAVAGRRFDPLLVFAAVIIPFTLLYRGRFVYWYEFRVLNNPTLDKDFDGYFLLPMLLFATWRVLCGNGLRWLALLAVGGGVMVWTHPVGPTYLLLSCGALVAATLHRQRLARAGAIMTIAAGAFTLCTLAIDPLETQPYVQELLRRDLAEGKTRYWIGHYTKQGTNSGSGIRYCCGDRPIVSPKHFFGSALVHSSVFLSLPWAGVFAWRRWRDGRGGPRPGGPPSSPAPALFAAGALALAAGVVWLFLPPELPTLSLLVVGALTGPLVTLLVMASAWVDAPSALPRESEGGTSTSDSAILGFREIHAMRLQAAYLALLLGLYSGAAVLLSHSMDLAGGIPRLSWLYLGFFPLAYGCAYLLWAAHKLFAHGVSRLPGSAAIAAERAFAALPALLLVLHVADQANALRQKESALLSRLGVGASVVDEWWHLSAPIARMVDSEDGGYGADAPLRAPPWLRDGDRVLISRSRMYTSFRGRYEVMKRAVFYREPYAEAFAFQHLGEDFLRELEAYNDFHDERVTEALISWLHAREVSVIVMSTRPETRRFIERLRQHSPFQIEKVRTGLFSVYRLHNRVSEGARPGSMPRPPPAKLD